MRRLIPFLHGSRPGTLLSDAIVRACTHCFTLSLTYPNTTPGGITHTALPRGPLTDQAATSKTHISNLAQPYQRNPSHGGAWSMRYVHARLHWLLYNIDHLSQVVLGIVEGEPLLHVGLQDVLGHRHRLLLWGWIGLGCKRHSEPKGQTTRAEPIPSNPRPRPGAPPTPPRPLSSTDARSPQGPPPLALLFLSPRPLPGTQPAAPPARH